MAKPPSSAIGIDLGRYAVKSVLINRRGANRFVVTHFAVQPVAEGGTGAEQVARSITALLSKMGGSAKGCSVAISRSDAVIRIIEQPETPPTILRDAVRLNGMTMLNQDVKDFVLDCDLIPPPNGEPRPPSNQQQYLVGGLPRSAVTEVDQALAASRRSLSAIQLGPVSAFNAFEFAKPEIFQSEPFILVDMGHVSSTVTVGVKGHLVLVRSIEYGGRTLLDALSAYADNKGPAEVLRQLESGDEMITETARVSLAALTREVSSSIGFFEARREETISHIFVSGGPARSQTLLNLMSEELHMPCEAWHPFEKCEISLPTDRKAAFAQEAVNLNIACGAAIELLKGN